MRVTGAETLRALAAGWFDKYGNDWRLEVRARNSLRQQLRRRHGAAWAYRVAPTKVIAFGDAHGQTTYRF